MTTTNQNHQKFQRLLRDLFQFDCAALDFGIYRIMNYKRKVIEKFISEDLIKAVSEELDRGILHDQDMAVIELQETAKLVRETFGPDALDAAGKLLLYHETPLGKKYLKWQQRTIGARSRASLEADIFNHLFRVLQPLLPGWRLYLQTPLLRATALCHSVQRRGGVPALGQLGPVLHQDRRALS